MPDFSLAPIGDTIAAVFSALSDSGMRYSVLRGYENLPNAPSGRDIDCLCHPADRESSRSIFLNLGFFPKAHKFHPLSVTFFSKKCTEGWLVFSWATELIPFTLFPIKGVKKAIEHRRKRDTFYTLGEEDEWLNLVLHCMLKGKFKPTHLEKLKALNQDLGEAKRAKHTMASLGLKLREIIKFVEAEKFDALSKQGQELLSKTKHISRQRFASKKKSQSLAFAFIGIDGAGKSTLIRRLNRHFDANTIMIPSVAVAYLGGKPVQGDPSFKTLWRILTLKGKINVMLFNAFHLYRKKWIRYRRAIDQQPTFLFLDRSFTDTLVKNDLRSKIKGKSFREWYLKLMFYHLAPKNIFLVMLDINAECSLIRKGEHDKPYLERKRSIYLDYVRHSRKAAVIDASQDKESVFMDALNLILESYAKDTQ